MINQSHYPHFAEQCCMLIALAMVVCVYASRYFAVVPVVVSCIAGAFAGVLVELHRLLPNGVLDLPRWIQSLTEYAQRPVPLKGPSSAPIAWFVLGHWSFHAGIGLVCGVLLLAVAVSANKFYIRRRQLTNHLN